MRMQDRNADSGPLLHVHYGYLRNAGVPEEYYSRAIDAIEAWDGFANVTDGGCNQLTPVNMNISFRCSESVWSSLGLSFSCLGITWLVDSNGNDVLNENDASSSNCIIDYAVIYMNPSSDIFYYGTNSETTVMNRIQKTMVHEIGHAMGLGHSDRESYNPISDSTPSVMRQGFLDEVNSGIVPQVHERADLRNMY